MSDRRDYVHRLAVRALHPGDVDAACRCLVDGRYTQGETVAAFEAALSHATGLRSAKGGFVACNSGSSALLLLARAAARHDLIQPGAEVVVPALSWSTTAWPFLQSGCRVVLADSDPETLALDPASAAAACRDGGSCAIVLVHILGLAAPVTPFANLANRLEINLFEDCCEAVAAFDRGHHVGSLSSMAAFSFYHSHQLSTIEGGAVWCGRGYLADECRSLRAHGWARDRADRAVFERTNPEIDPTFLFVGEGFNLRMTEPQAAIGLSQLGRLRETVRTRLEVFVRVGEMLSAVPWLRVPGLEQARRALATGDGSHSAMFVPAVVAKDAPTDRAAVVAALERHGVETRPIIAGNLGRHPAFANDRIGDRVVSDRVPLPVADMVMRRGFMIGCPPDTMHEGIEVITAACAEMRT